MRTRLVIGGGLVALGALWFGQGIGLIGGSFMTGQAIWAVFGALAVSFGLPLIIGAMRPRRGPDPDDAPLAQPEDRQSPSSEPQ